jgi:hypothetical protein
VTRLRSDAASPPGCARDAAAPDFWHACRLFASPAREAHVTIAANGQGFRDPASLVRDMLPGVFMRGFRRLVPALALLVGLAAAPLARAADAPKPPADAAEVMPAYSPLAAVAVMLKTGQALVFDDTSNRYFVVMVGDVLSGWKVVAIEEKRVIVVHGEERDELELVPPPRPIEGFKLPASAQVAPVTPAKPTEVVDPYAEPAKPAKPAAKIEDELVPAKKLTRGELNREISDFDRLDAAVDFAPAPGGGFELTRVDKGSWLFKLGLREGDVVRAVGGQRMASVDDAARVYAALRSTKAFTIELDRLVPATADTPAARKRVTLSFQITGQK